MSASYADTMLQSAGSALHALTIHDYFDACVGSGLPDQELNVSCFDDRIAQVGESAKRSRPNAGANNHVADLGSLSARLGQP